MALRSLTVLGNWLVLPGLIVLGVKWAPARHRADATAPRHSAGQQRQQATESAQPGLPVCCVSPRFETYRFPSGNAAAVARTLRREFKQPAFLRIAVIGTDRLLVYAFPEVQMEVAKRIQALEPNGVPPASPDRE
jgi:hypothetical protein